MPVNMAVQEPGARIVGGEPNGDVVSVGSNVDNVTTDGVVIVVGVRTRAPHNSERVTYIRVRRGSNKKTF